MKSLFRQILSGVIGLAKSLTFWSVLLGAFITWVSPLYVSFYKILIEKGWLAALQSRQYPWLVPVAFLFISLFGLFYVTERKQSAKSGEITNEIMSKLDNITLAIKENTNELKKMQLMFNKPHDEEGDTRPDN